MNLSILLQAEDGSGLMGLILPALAILVMYFFFIRPQSKKRKEAQSFRDSIAKGDKVVTIGGIHGKVSQVNDATITITTEGGKLVIERSAVSANSASNEQEVEINK